MEKRSEQSPIMSQVSGAGSLESLDAIATSPYATAFQPRLPVMTPKGPAHASYRIDYTEEHHVFWVVTLDETQERWAFMNSEIRSLRELARFLAPELPHGRRGLARSRLMASRVQKLGRAGDAWH